MKLLIVDDEVIIRTGLSTVIPWADYGYELLIPAASAEEAIARLEAERPSIVLTDIQMTGLTGLDLARETKRLLPETEVIILTGYDQFQYAQKAIVEGVGDYLLKTSRPDEIMKAVGGARQRIVMRGESPNKDHLHDELLETLIAGGDMEYSFLRKGIELLPRLRLQEPSRYIVCVIGASGWGERSGYGKLLLFAVHNVINELLDGEALLHEDHIVLIRRQQEEGVNQISHLESELQPIERKLKCRLQAAAGDMISGLTELKRSYEKAVSVYLYHELLPNTRLLTPEDVSGRKGGRTVCSNEEERQLALLLTEGDSSAISHWIRRLVAVEIKNDEATPQSLQSYLISLQQSGRSRVAHLTKIEGLSDATNVQLPQSRTIPLERVAEKGCEELTAAMLELADYYHSASGKINMPIMNRVLAYIHEHLDEDLSLQGMAKRMQLTPHHFSEVFHRETGLPYPEYVAKMRMEKAKVLLGETDASVSEIASRVGFGDLEYFYHVFSTYAGLSPWEYRRETSGM